MCVGMSERDHSMSKAYTTSSFRFFISFYRLRLYYDSSSPFHYSYPLRMMVLIS